EIHPEADGVIRRSRVLEIRGSRPRRDAPVQRRPTVARIAEGGRNKQQERRDSDSCPQVFPHSLPFFTGLEALFQCPHSPGIPGDRRVAAEYWNVNSTGTCSSISVGLPDPGDER